MRVILILLLLLCIFFVQLKSNPVENTDVDLNSMSKEEYEMRNSRFESPREEIDLDSYDFTDNSLLLTQHINIIQREEINDEDEIIYLCMFFCQNHYKITNSFVDCNENCTRPFNITIDEIGILFDLILY
jgi:hypothetical protein